MYNSFQNNWDNYIPFTFCDQYLLNCGYSAAKISVLINKEPHNSTSGYNFIEHSRMLWKIEYMQKTGHLAKYIFGGVTIMVS